jgi:hypothetical protein
MIFCGLFFILFIPSSNIKFIKIYSLYFSGFIFVLSLFFLIHFWFADFFKTPNFFGISIRRLIYFYDLDFVFSPYRANLFYFDFDYL